MITLWARDQVPCPRHTAELKSKAGSSDSKPPSLPTPSTAYPGPLVGRMASLTKDGDFHIRIHHKQQWQVMGASLWEGWHKTINPNSHSCFCRRENVYSVLLIHPWVCNCSFKDNGYSSLKWWSWSFLFTSAWYILQCPPRTKQNSL